MNCTTSTAWSYSARRFCHNAAHLAHYTTKDGGHFNAESDFLEI
ncbi:MAG TPA: hypothetical protein VOA64_21500 [Candidatus Dormibacteraeota bacterium]|nr:hypothetical protein [Candidatus Dormibacteraeota bacterium]